MTAAFIALPTVQFLLTNNLLNNRGRPERSVHNYQEEAKVDGWKFGGHHYSCSHTSHSVCKFQRGVRFWQFQRGVRFWQLRFPLPNEALRVPTEWCVFFVLNNEWQVIHKRWTLWHIVWSSSPLYLSQHCVTSSCHMVLQVLYTHQKTKKHKTWQVRSYPRSIRLLCPCTRLVLLAVHVCARL